MNNYVAKYLSEKGYDKIYTDYYNYIKLWEDWYKNNVEFHRYYDTYGTQRTMYSAGMAKRGCEDWGNIVTSERDEIKTGKEQNDKYIAEFLKESKLNRLAPEYVETSAWSGNCAVITRVKNAIVGQDGILKANNKTIKELIKVSAKNIIPLRVEHGEIIDVAFVSNTMVGKRKACYIELHELKDKGYQISNVFIDEETGEELKNDNVLKTYNTTSNVPLFAILKTPKSNPIDDNMGLGFSMYGNAIDQLKSCDIAYHNAVMDFFLGGKKIIYNKKLIKYVKERVKNSDGTESYIDVPVYPDDISKQQFMEVGDSDMVNDNELIHEYNPTLRVDENEKGLQTFLSFLGFKMGLGTDYYQFNGSTIVTATQYVGDRQDLVANAKSYRENYNKFISDIIRANLLIGRLIFGEKVTEDCQVSIVNLDGFLVDDETAKEEDRKAMAMGLMSKISYLMKWRGLDEEQAKKELELVESENTIKDIELGE